MADWSWSEDVEWAPARPEKVVDPTSIGLDTEDFTSKPDDVLTEEGDPLSGDDGTEEAHLMIEDGEQPRNFASLKPWLGGIAAPTGFDPTTADLSEPTADLQLDQIFGYRARNCRNNVHWVDVKNLIIVYPAAAVGVVLDVRKEKQEFYMGHNDDIVCLDYHSPSKLVASGSIGAHNTVRLCIWEVDTRKERHCIVGFHQFAVVAVCFTPNGDNVVSVGMDTHHSIAVYNVNSGLMMASCEGDKNRIVHVRPLGTANADPNTMFVTVGVSHVAFWKGDRREREGINWYKGSGSDIANAVCGSIEFTSQFTLVGSQSGKIYAFYELPNDDFKVVYEFRAHTGWVNTMLNMGGDIVVSGGSEGTIQYWDFSATTTATDAELQPGISASLSAINIKVVPTRASQARAARTRSVTPPAHVVGDTDAPLYQGAQPAPETFGSAPSTTSFSVPSPTKTLPKTLPKSQPKSQPTAVPASTTTASPMKKGPAMPKKAVPPPPPPVVPIPKEVNIKTIDVNGFDKATANDSKILVNSVRSLAKSGDGKLLIGTVLNQVYIVDEKTKAPIKDNGNPVQGHWGSLRDKYGYGELWGIDVHPTESWVYTTSDDGTVRCWETNRDRCLYRLDLKYMGRCIGVSANGKMVAVGHKNGSFTVVNADLSAVIMPPVRDRKRRILSLAFSPNSKYLAVGAVEPFIDIYSVDKNFERVGICRGHSSNVTALDWNVHSTIIQTTSRAYELLFFSIPDCRQITSAQSLRDEAWFTQTCCIGWPVQGIWPRFADGTDVNSVGKSKSQKLLAVTDDWGRVRLYRYPCVGIGFEKKGPWRVPERPNCKIYTGHCSHVTNCVWSSKDDFVYTTGGGDLCMFRWKVIYPAGDEPKPETFLRPAEPAPVGVDELLATGRPGTAASTQGVTTEASSTLGARSASGVQPHYAQNAGQDGGLPPANCPMCDHLFDDIDVQICPRCRSPRRLVKAPPRKKLNFTHAKRRAGSANSPKKAEVQSRFMQPTKAFAEQSKVSQEQGQHRRQSEDEEKAKMNKMGLASKWLPSPVAKKLPLPLPVSSDDEEVAQAKLKLKKKKKTAGPDFSDF